MEALLSTGNLLGQVESDGKVIKKMNLLKVFDVVTAEINGRIFVKLSCFLPKCRGSINVYNRNQYKLRKLTHFFLGWSSGGDAKTIIDSYKNILKDPTAQLIYRNAQSRHFSAGTYIPLSLLPYALTYLNLYDSPPEQDWQVIWEVIKTIPLLPEIPLSTLKMEIRDCKKASDLSLLRQEVRTLTNTLAELRASRTIEKDVSF
jgi:hypothetical protein